MACGPPCSLEVEQKLGELKTKTAKIEALKAQLSFRKKVLSQESDKNLFQFSQNRKPLTVQELAHNLCELLLLHHLRFLMK